MKECMNLILFIIIIILLFLNLNKHTETFNNIDNDNIKISIYSSLVKVYKSQDFNTFGLINKLKYGIIKYKNQIINNNGISLKSLNEYKNIIIIPGLGDCILKQNNEIVWPINCKNINKYNYTSVHINNNSHLQSIINLFNSLNYKSDKLNILVYDFINFNILKIVTMFKQLIKENTIIIAYDFGAVVANLCIQKLSSNEKNKIKNLLYICPTIGGVPLAIREYLNGNKIIDAKSTQNIDTNILSLPNKYIYNEPVIIYNKIKYSSNNLNELIKENLNSDFDNIDSLKLQEESLKNPNINTIIIGSDGYNTPICYDYENNLMNLKEQNLNKFQVNGDSVVPLQNLTKLTSLWSNNCKLEIIKNKNHYSILKCYELHIIILHYLNN